MRRRRSFLVIVGGVAIASCSQAPAASSSDASSGGSSDNTTTSSTSEPTSSGESSSSATSATSGSNEGVAESSSSTTAAILDCTDINPEFECEPVDCADPTPSWATCGPIEMFDENGCLRTWCYEDSECGDGDICYHPADCDPKESGCTPLAGCGVLDGECTCTVVGGCEDPPEPPFRGWCIAAADSPC